MEYLKCSLEKFGWTNEVVEKLEGPTVSEVGQILKDCACRVVKKAQERSKLSVLWNLIRRRGKVRCVQVREEGAQMHSVRTKRWHSGATGGDQQMGGDGMGEQNQCPVQLR